MGGCKDRRTNLITFFEMKQLLTCRQTSLKSTFIYSSLLFFQLEQKGKLQRLIAKDVSGLKFYLSSFALKALNKKLSIFHH